MARFGFAALAVPLLLSCAPAWATSEECEQEECVALLQVRKATTEAPVETTSAAPSEADAGPTVVKGGEECNGSLAPQFATICEDGFDCVTPDQTMTGQTGVCKPKGPTVVKAGEKCNGSLSPQFATICEDGFDCVTPDPTMTGQTGVCKPKGPTVVKAGEKCNGSLPPQFATICEDGFDCVTPKNMYGASGVCKAKGDDAPVVIAASGQCTLEDLDALNKLGGGNDAGAFTAAALACGRQSIGLFFNWKPRRFDKCLEKKVVGLERRCTRCFERGAKSAYDNCKVQCLRSSCSTECQECVAKLEPEVDACVGTSQYPKPEAMPC